MSTDERINDLIERAGSPVIVVRNTHEDELECRPDTYLGMQRIIDEPFGGSAISYIKHLAGTIDRMEASLANVISERDQLLDDLHRMIKKHNSCDFCVHKNKNAAECNGCNRKNDHWEWRGISEKEDA